MRLTRRRFLALVPAAGALLVACGGGEDDDDSDVLIEALRRRNEAPAGSPTPDAASGGAPVVATPLSRVNPDDLYGFTFPVAGGCIPSSDALMPNAPRTYRNGIHEGVDFYNGTSCAVVGFGTPVLAMYDGRVIRADLDYKELTLAQLRVLQQRTQAQGFTDEETLDIYRGRQVWVDHGRGIVTRYAHLASIADGITVGTMVRAGQPLGGVGESGTPESLTDPGTEMHVHAEVRVGDSFLGKDLPPAQVRALYERLFTPEPAAGRAP